MKIHDGPHDAEHPFPDCFGCKVKGGFRVAPSAIPSRRNAVPPRRAEPSWEKGRAGEFRPDGSFMPILNEKGMPMPVYEAQNRRSEIDRKVKRLKSDPNVFSPS